MEIKPTVTRVNNDIGSTQATTNKADNSAASNVSSTASGNAADLTLTDTAKNLLDMQSTVSSVDDVDMAKVEALRQSIEDGTYEVDTAKLADNLVQSSLELP